MSYEPAVGTAPKDERRLENIAVAVIGSSGPNEDGQRGAGWSFMVTSKPDLIYQDGMADATAPPGRPLPTITDAVCQAFIKILRDLVARLRELGVIGVGRLHLFTRTRYIVELLVGQHDGTRHEHLLAYRDEINALIKQLAPEHVRIECPAAEIS